MQRKVVIIDYNLGNLFSVEQACRATGIDAEISASKTAIDNADALILPGVGAFIEAMQNLDQQGLVETIKNNVKSGKPIFGVCLGLQLLFSKSEEFGSGEGLDLIQGTIKKFPATIDGKKIRVPQIAWNKIYADHQDWNDSPLKGISQNEFMYFVHSYYVDPANDSCILTKTNYEGMDYCSGILKDNIFATQFHPEKSAQKGILIYKNWASDNNLI
jgi:glutamine amidotransferase